MERLVCLQILRPARNSQGTSRPVAGHISPPRFELSDPRFSKTCVGKNPEKTLCERENKEEMSVEML